MASWSLSRRLNLASCSRGCFAWGYSEASACQAGGTVVFYVEGKIFWDKNKPNGSMSKILDTSKQNKIIKWRPSVDIDTGLLRTVEWLLKDEKIDIY